MAVGFPDLVNGYIGGNSIKETATASVNGSAIDLTEGEGPVHVVVSIGAASGTSPTMDAKLQESVDGSTGWADVAGATLAQKTDSDANTQSVFETHGRGQPFVRVVATVGGTTPSFHLHAAVLSKSKSY